MARIANLHVPVSGKVGNLVYCTGSKGSYVRSAPKKNKRPPTQKQLASQLRFKMGCAFLRPFRQFIENTWHPIGNTTPFNEVFGLLLRQGISGEYPAYGIDFKNVMLSRGNLLPPIFAAGELEGQELCICWAVVNQHRSWRDDQLVLAFYNESKDVHMVFRPDVQRGAGVAYLPVSDTFASDKLHAWLSFESHSGKDTSDSIYINIQS